MYCVFDCGCERMCVKRGEVTYSAAAILAPLDACECACLRCERERVDIPSVRLLICSADRPLIRFRIDIKLASRQICESIVSDSNRSMELLMTKNNVARAVRVSACFTCNYIVVVDGIRGSLIYLRTIFSQQKKALTLVISAQL